MFTLTPYDCVFISLVGVSLLSGIYAALALTLMWSAKDPILNLQRRERFSRPLKWSLILLTVLAATAVIMEMVHFIFTHLFQCH